MRINGLLIFIIFSGCVSAKPLTNDSITPDNLKTQITNEDAIRVIKKDGEQKNLVVDYSTSYDIEVQYEDLSGNTSAKSNKITQTTDAASGGGVTEVEDFENNTNPDPTFWNQWKLEGAENASAVADDPTIGGSNDVMIVDISRPPVGTPFISANARSEPTRRDGTADIPEWLPYGFEGSYQYRFYIPEEFDWDPNHLITMSQLKPPRHDDLPLGKPNVTLRIDNRHIDLTVRWEPDEQNVKDGIFSDAGYDGNGKMTLNKGVWCYVIIDYTISINHGGGLVNYYFKEGSVPTVSDLIHTHTSGTAYNTTYVGIEGLYLKFGIYDWQWRTDFTVREDTPGEAEYLGTDVVRHILYFDDVTLQDHHEFSLPWWLLLLANHRRSLLAICH